jgi:hypothetical protein
MEQTDNKSKRSRIKRSCRARLRVIKGYITAHSRTSIAQQNSPRKKPDEAQTLTDTHNRNATAANEVDKVPTKEYGDSTLCAGCRTLFAHDYISSEFAHTDGRIQIRISWRSLEDSSNSGCRFCMFLFATSHMEHAAPEIGDQDTVTFEFRNILERDHLNWQVTATSDKFSDQTSFLQVSVHKGTLSLLVVDGQRLT